MRIIQYPDQPIVEHVQSSFELADISHPTPSTMRVGHRPDSYDVVTKKGERWFAWKEDQEVSDDILVISGVKKVVHASAPNGDTLYASPLPVSARSAASVLAGTEAWDGEKLDLLTAVTQYIGRLARLRKHLFNASLSLDSIAVTRADSDTMIVLPPYKIIENPDSQQLSDWQDSFLNDINLIVGDNTQANNLRKKFENKFNKIWHTQR